jgi:hypothetical protein
VWTVTTVRPAALQVKYVRGYINQDFIGMGARWDAHSHQRSQDYHRGELWDESDWFHGFLLFH